LSSFAKEIDDWYYLKKELNNLVKVNKRRLLSNEKVRDQILQLWKLLTNKQTVKISSYDDILAEIKANTYLSDE